MRIRKILSLLSAAAVAATTMTALSVTAGAVEALTDFTYSLAFTEVPTAGDTADIKDAEENTVMTITYLGGEWKVSGTGIAPNANADRATASKGAYVSGCAIQFVPAVNGEVLVDRKLGTNKILNIEENGTLLYSKTNTGASSISTSAEVANYTVDVEAGNTYIAYTTGTGDPFYGIYFEPASSSTHTLSGAVSYAGTADTTGWKLVFTDTKDGSTLEADFGEDYSVEATQNRTYDITLVDAEGNAPEATTITLDTNSVYVGKEDVSFDINVVDFALTEVTGDVFVHDVYNDGTSLDLSNVTLTFTAEDDAELKYETGIELNSISLSMMPNHNYKVTASGNDGYTLSPLSSEYFMVAGDTAPFKNILFTENVSGVTFKSTVEVGEDKEFDTISDAITAIKAMTRPAGEAGRVTIAVDPGTYTEQVIVDTSYITIKSASETEKPEINWYYGIGYLYYSSADNGYFSEDCVVARTKKGAVQRWGAACRITGDYVYLENIKLVNTFNCEITLAELADGVEAAKNNEYSDVNGKVERDTEGFDPMTKPAVERAAAVAFDGAHAEAYKCEFISSQDTFYTGKAAYIKDCYIEGGTDFIFGGNSVVFDGCTLAWHGYSDQANGGYLTANKNSAAPGTADGNGYLFKNTTIAYSKYFPDNYFAAGSWGRNWGGANTQVVFDGVDLQVDDIPGAWVKMGGELDTSVLYVTNVLQYDEPVEDVSAYNPNGMMADNGYTEMAMTDYFGDWTPPHYTAPPAKCIKITATYKEDGSLDSVVTEEVNQTEAKAAEKIGNTLVTYWDSLEGMKPVVVAEPTEPTIEVIEPEKTVVVGDGVVWSANDMEAGTYNATFEINGLYIGAGIANNDDGTTTTKSVVIDSALSSSGKPTTISGTDYTQRIKTGGNGDPETGYRCFYFKPDSDCSLVLDATASSGGATRDVVVIHGDTTEHIDVSDKASYKLEGLKADETVVIYSAEGGLNVYGLKLTTGSDEPETPADKTLLPANVTVNFDGAYVDGVATSYTDGAVVSTYVYVYGSGEMVVDTSNKTINGTKYATRLKMNGVGSFNDDGTPKNRVISVVPQYDGELVVDFAHASSSGDARTLEIKQGDNTANSAVEAGQTGTVSMEVTANKEVYIYSVGGGCNVYGITLKAEGAPVPVDESMLPAGTTIIFDTLIDEEYSADTKILDYVTVYSGGSTITVTSTDKTVDGVKYLSVLKLGGNAQYNTDGTPKSRAISVTPAAAGKLKVHFVTASTNALTRSLTAKQGEATQKVTVGEDGTGTLEMDVEAGTEVYLYATEGAVNIYDISLN